MTAEALYLLALVRSHAAEGPPPRAPEGMDEGRFLALARAHRLVPALAPRLGPGLRRRVEAERRDAARRQALLLLELSRFLPSLEDAGLRPLVLKGAALALAREIYPRPEDRQFNDLDVLVPLGAVDAACERLAGFGYRCRASRRGEDFYDRHHFHRVLRSPSGIAVELHWQLTRPRGYVRCDVAGLLERSRLIERDGVLLRVPSDGDQLLHAAVQGLQEGFSDLRRALDAARLLRAGRLDPDLGARAADQGLATALWLVLAQAARLGAPLPAELESEVRPGPAVRRCLRSLDLLENGAEGRDAPGSRTLARWLCSPSAGAAVGEIGRYLAGPVGGPEAAVGRVLHAVRRGGSVARLAAWQGWRAASHRESR